VKTKMDAKEISQQGLRVTRRGYCGSPGQGGLPREATETKDKRSWMKRPGRQGLPGEASTKALRQASAGCVGKVSVPRVVSDGWEQCWEGLW
jgi:hypothetical protein